METFRKEALGRHQRLSSLKKEAPFGHHDEMIELIQCCEVVESRRAGDGKECVEVSVPAHVAAVHSMQVR